MFSCCSRYRECSEKGFCINPFPYLQEECSYRIKLQQGIRFFKPKQEKKSDRTYILIDNRAFYIGILGSYGSSSRRLDEKQREVLKEQLGGIQVSDRVESFNCVDENFEVEPANCRVMITLGKDKYIIHNYNIRGITHATATELRNYFRDRNILAAIEVLGRRGYQNTVSILQEKKKEPKREIVKQNVMTSEIVMLGKTRVEQLNLFGMM